MFIYQIRGVLFTFIVLMIASLPLQAQDEVTDVPNNVLGTYIISIQSGTLQATGTENEYVIEIVGLEEDITWVFNTPTFRAGRISKASLTLDWAQAGSDVVTQAILTTEDEVLMLDLYAPNLGGDRNTIRYVATVKDLIPLYEVNAKIGPVMPETFGIATLVIETDAEFEDALLAGARERVQTVREVSGSQTCIRGRNCPENDPLYRGNDASDDDTDGEDDTNGTDTDESDTEPQTDVTDDGETTPEGSEASE